MNKKIIYSFVMVAMMGISLWALVIGYVGTGEKTLITSKGISADGNWGLSFQEDGQQHQLKDHFLRHQ